MHDSDQRIPWIKIAGTKWKALHTDGGGESNIRVWTMEGPWPQAIVVGQSMLKILVFIESMVILRSLFPFSWLFGFVLIIISFMWGRFRAIQSELATRKTWAASSTSLTSNRCISIFSTAAHNVLHSLISHSPTMFCKSTSLYVILSCRLIDSWIH